MVKITDLSTTFHTSKVRECVDFYVKYLGAEICFDAGWYVVVCFESHLSPPVTLSFQDAPHTNRQESAGGATLNFRIEDVDAEYEKITKKGIIFEEEITDHTWGDRAFSILDPIGNVVYIYSERPLGDEYKNAVK